jgi:hypothetical protein
MRIGILVGLLILFPAWAKEPPKGDKGDGKRYGIALDLKAYPQGTAKEALASVLKAINAKKIDYLLAHLADPGFVDDRVKRLYGGRFEEQVQDTAARLDPFTVKELRRFLKDGTWSFEKTEAVVRLKDVKNRQVKLHQKGSRWFLEHPSKR